MKKIVLSLLVVSALMSVSCKKNGANESDSKIPTEAAISSEGAKYVASTTESVINWSGSKPAGKHSGTINLKDGEILVKDNKVVSGKFTINMNTITVTDLKSDDGKEDLEAHLKGTGDKEGQDHFFNIKKYPSGFFAITSIEEKEGKTIVYGNLTLKDVTKSVNFPANISVSDNEVTIDSDTLVLNRTYWNINYASRSLFDNLKDKFINDEIEIQVRVKATK
ncbi:YCE I like family protein [Flavobacterium saliperosum S13]|uniref:YceI-like domain-containing protein n=2 Tax=Flavobacterium saliperosum TaxID=329186 RepID=A0A1G4WAI4_9FLAO|nr:YceI family protein [Flavobacterium saliperosum]ESU22486.1 YCE I like family protein [Flavobacterium saliperosum S13]SCX18769.1 YceI-like domain-containing protein [Flavobacterium saliperosum]